MQAVLWANLCVSLMLFFSLDPFSMFEESDQHKNYQRLGLSFALVGNVALFVWLAMWKHAPPVFPIEYWKFLGCATIVAVSAVVSFVTSWLLRGVRRILLALSGAVLMVLSLLAGIASLRVS